MHLCKILKAVYSKLKTILSCKASGVMTENQLTKLEEIVKKFSERLTDINLYQRASKETASKELEALNQYAERLKSIKDSDAYGMSTHAMHFNDPETGQPMRYGYRQQVLKIAIYRF